MGNLTGLSFGWVSSCPEKPRIAVLGCPSPVSLGTINTCQSHGPSPILSGASTSRAPHTVSVHANLNFSVTVLWTTQQSPSVIRVLTATTQHIMKWNESSDPILPILVIPSNSECIIQHLPLQNNSLTIWNEEYLRKNIKLKWIYTVRGNRKHMGSMSYFIYIFVLLHVTVILQNSIGFIFSVIILTLSRWMHLHRVFRAVCFCCC